MSIETFHDGRVTLHGGDCLDVMAAMEAKSVDAIVTDPPYELGFMGRAWDKSGIAFDPATWAAALRVLKPGGHLVAFAAPKNAHRMVCAIEDAGFEIRDCLMWLFGSGFPKSLNVGGGFGTALKPAYEPICVARKPLVGTVAANVLAHGTGALNIDACRIGSDGGTAGATRGGKSEPVHALNGCLNGAFGRPVPGLGRWPANIVHDGSDEVVAAFPSEPAGKGVVRPFERTRDYGGIAGNEGGSFRQGVGQRASMIDRDDVGSAARFFYSAKADADDRIGSKHPTVKPLALMQWLVRMVTPPGGVILDPFAGTGTTGEAALREGFRAVLIEREAIYRADIARRMRHAFDGEDGRKRAIVKARGQADYSAGPLFGHGEAAE